jgi:hypothetical protein
MHSNTVRDCYPAPIYTIKDLQRKLEKLRGRRVPIDTLKRWRHRLGISPVGRLYDRDDYEMLAALMTFVDRGGSITQFVNLAKQKQHGS